MSGIVKITTTILTFGKVKVVLSFTVKLLPVPVDNNETGDYRWENLSVRNCLSVELLKLSCLTSRFSFFPL